MKETKNKRKFIKYIAYLAVVTTIITSTTLAKYADEAKMQANVVVALFTAGTSTSEEIAITEMLSPGSTEEVVFKVQNFSQTGELQYSEVALGYDIKIETIGNLPLTFQMSGERLNQTDDMNKLTGELAKVTDKEYSATGGELPVGVDDAVVHEYKLQITWPDEENDVKYSDEIDMLTITIETTQINPQDQNKKQII